MDQTLRINRETIKQHDRYAELLDELKNLSISLHYMSDDRKHQGQKRTLTLNPIPFSAPDIMVVGNETRYPMIYGITPPSGIAEWEEEGRDSLQDALRRVKRWADIQVRKGSRQGQGDLDAVYSRVLRDIEGSLDVQSEHSNQEVRRLAAELVELRKRSEEYCELGLVPKLEINETLQSIHEASAATLPALYRVLETYVKVAKTRLAALEKVHSVMKKFLDTVNTFYRDKSVQFHIDTGISIHSREKLLDPRRLSSGEKQLLYLFCNTILAREPASLLLIDEPELSLNLNCR